MASTWGSFSMTEEKVNTVLKALRAGASRKHAAAAARISERGFAMWFERGQILYNFQERQAAGEDLTEADLGPLARLSEEIRNQYIRFYLDVVETEGKSVVDTMEQITAAGVIDWRAAAWKLERRYPKDYGKKEGLDITSAGNELTGLTADRLHKAAEQADKELAEFEEANQYDPDTAHEPNDDAAAEGID